MLVNVLRIHIALYSLDVRCNIVNEVINNIIVDSLVTELPAQVGFLYLFVSICQS